MMRRKICIISAHPSPYRDPALSAFYKLAGEAYDITFLHLYGFDEGHPYQEKGHYDYPCTVLKEKRLFGKIPFHPEIHRILRTGKFDAVLVPGYSRLTCIYAIFYCLVKKVPLIFFRRYGGVY